MAERKGPEGEPPGHDPGGSGQQDDRSSCADEREPVSADEGTELSDNDRESGSTESDPTQSSTSGDDEATEASVLPFRQSDSDGSAAADRDRGDGDQPSDGDPSDGDPAERGDLADEGLDEEDLEDPVDLAALQADDELLDALGGPNPVLPEAPGTGPSVDEMLVAWRQDVDAAPIDDLVDIDTAAATIAQARRPRRKHLKRWHLVPVASAAAVLMITGTGFGLAARDAQPGDMLWGVAQVLYSDHTRGVQAATVAREELDNAEGAIVGGDRSSAEAALRSAQQEMEDVDQDHGLRELRAAHSSLTARMGEGGEQPEQTSQTTTETQVLPPSGTQEPSPSLPPRPPDPTGSTTAPPSSSEPSETTTSPSETSGSSEERPPGESPGRPSEGFDSQQLFPSSGEDQ